LNLEATKRDKMLGVISAENIATMIGDANAAKNVSKLITLVNVVQKKKMSI